MAEKQLFETVRPELRAQMLADNAYAKENRTYQKDFSQEEIEEFKSRLAESMIELNSLSDDLKEVKKEYAQKMDPIKNRLQGLLEYIKFGSRQVTEEVFLFDHQEEGLMALYNVEGELVHSRKLLPNERQTKMRLMKTGTEE